MCSAAEAGCTYDEKDELSVLDDFISTIPKHDCILFGEDMNGHVNQECIDSSDHLDIYGFGVRNVEREGILVFATADGLPW